MVGESRREDFAIGVDLGTSNTVAVIRWPDGRTRPLLFDGQPVMPSLVFLDEGGHLHFGRDAQRMALLDPARCEPNPKRRIDERTVLLGDREVPVVELLATILRAVAAKAHESVGFLPRAVLTHPAAWGAPRREVLQAAAARAGFPPVTLVPEPVAAVRYFTDVMRQPVPVGHAVAVFDFGGGTLDVAVVRNDDGAFTVIGSGGLQDLGGLDVDAALANHLGEVLRSNGHGAIWQQLSAPTNTTERRHRRLFWEDVRGAKEMLSRTTVAPVSIPGLDQALHLTRDELERLATPLLERAVAETSAVIRRSGISREAFAGLFLVGGASRIPLVSRLLHTRLGIAPTVLEQPELPVAEGALAEVASLAPASHNPVVAVSAPTHRNDATGVGATAPVSAQPGASAPVTAVPVSPASPESSPPADGAWQPPTPVEAPPLPPKSWWRKPPLVAAVAALLVVALVATVLVSVRGYEERPFVPLGEPFEVPAEGAEESELSSSWVRVAGSMAFHIYETTSENTFRVTAINLATHKVAWRSQELDLGADLYAVFARPTYLAIFGDKPSDEDGTQAVRVLKAEDGTLAWEVDVPNEDGTWLDGNTVFIYRKADGETTAYDPRTGAARWTKKDDKAWQILWPRTWADEQGPSNVYGNPFQRSPFTDPRLVIINDAREAFVVDEMTGKEKKRGNVANRSTGDGDFVDTNIAYEGKLFVAEGGNVQMFNLDDLNDHDQIFSLDNDGKIVGMSPCGRTLICVYDNKSMLSIVDFSSGERVFFKPKVESLKAAFAVGDRIVAVYKKDDKPVTEIWDASGDQIDMKEGEGARVDPAGLLIRAAGPLKGIVVRSGALQEIGSLPDHGDCVYDADDIACVVPDKKGVVVWRYRG